MNFITIAGHLGSDPEVRFTSTGKKVTVFRVATRSRKGANHDDTIWYRVTLWGDQHDKMVPHFKKGSAIVVCGELHRPELFTDREGKPQISSLEITASYIQFSPFGKGGSGGHQGHEGASQEGGSFGASSFGGAGSQFGASSHFGAPASNPGVSSFGAAPSFQDSTSFSTGGGAGGTKGELHEDEVPF